MPDMAAIIKAKGGSFIGVRCSTAGEHTRLVMNVANVRCVEGYAEWDAYLTRDDAKRLAYQLLLAADGIKP